MKMTMKLGWAAGIAMAVATAGAGAQNVALAPGTYKMMAAAAGQTSGPKVKDDLFAGTEIFEKGASDVTEITMDPDSLDMVRGKDGQRAHSMVLNVVRTYSYDKPGMYNMADVDVFRNKLNTGDWHCSVHTRELKTGESTDICAKRRTDDLRETAIITVSPKSLTFIHTIKHSNGGNSELGDLPLMSFGHLPMVAMMDPEQFADMQIGLAGLRNLTPIDMAGLQESLQRSLGNMKVHVDVKDFDFEKMNRDLKNLNSDELKLKLNKLNSDQMEKHLDDMQKNLDQLNTSEGQQKLKDAQKNPGVTQDLGK